MCSCSCQYSSNSPIVHSVLTALILLFEILSTDLLTYALREAILIRDGIFALSNVNHLSTNELNSFPIESLAIDLN